LVDLALSVSWKISSLLYPEALHRVVATLDSLPHNGYVVTTIRVICGETHQDVYNAVGALIVIVPLLECALAIILFSLGLGI
jgi:hypothetical protein